MKKTIKKEFFHPGGENLPSDGWFQQCILCYSITANLIFLESSIDKSTSPGRTLEYCGFNKTSSNVRANGNSLIIQYLLYFLFYLIIHFS